MNTAIGTDDGNLLLRERARKALIKWREVLTSVISEGVNKKEIKREIDANGSAAWRGI